jgi:uridine kinase
MEALYMTNIALKQLRSSAPGKVIVVGIAGPTGAGKTTLATKLSSMIEGSKVISMRDYFRPKSGRRGPQSRALYCDRASDPASFDIQLLTQHLQCLKRGESVRLHPRPFCDSCPSALTHGAH